MNKKPHAFIRRSSAVCAAAALALSGAFIAVPANASPDKETTATTAPATEAPATQAPATEGAVIDDPALVEAIKRDLGMTVEEFVAAGELGTKAADAVKELSAIEGYEGIALVDSKKVVVSGTGDALKAAVKKLGFEFKDTAAKKAEASDVGTTKPAPAKAEVKETYKGDVVALYNEYAAKNGIDGLVSVTTDQQGNFFITKKANSNEAARSAEAPEAGFTSKFSNVSTETAPELTQTRYDVPGGHGIIMDETKEPTGSIGLCSLGFNGWNKDGQPAGITAGHCTSDGTYNNVSLSDPRADLQGDSGVNLGSDLSSDYLFGAVSFSQFGGPGNSVAENVDFQNWDNTGNVGTDIAVIDGIPESYDLPAAVTQWGDGTNLSADAVKVTSVRNAVVGDAVCKSGRTTFWTCGTVNRVGVALTGGDNYPADQNDIRATYGFEFEGANRETISDSGDSGGSIIAGSVAVGTLTGGRQAQDPETGAMYDISVGNQIEEGLAVTDGYTVALYVNAPTLVSPENNGTVVQGGTITGAVADAADGTKVVIKSAGAEDQYVAVTDGQWTIKAPNSSGKYNFTAQAINGFNKSAVADFTVDVKAAPMDKPTINSPKDGETFGRVLAYYGTGTPGATVELKGAGIDGTVTVTVDADGKWSYQVEGGVPFSNDAQKIEARQAAKGDRAASEWVSSSFFVKPGPVTITNPGGGAKYDQGTASIKIEGTASVDGEVRVGFDGGVAAMFEVKDGKWTASLPAKDLAAGTYDIVASQTVDGVAAPEARVGIEIVAPAPTETPKPTEEPTVPPTESPKPTDQPTTSPSPQPTCETEVVVEIGPDGKPTAKAIPVDPNCDNNGDGLPDTGANGMTMPLVFAGSALLLAGAGAVAYTAIRRRKAQH